MLDRPAAETWTGAPPTPGRRTDDFARQPMGRGARLEQAAVLLVTCLAFALRLHELGRQSLWLDEGLSLYFARLPLPALLTTVIERDLHPPLHVLLLHLWLPMSGVSELAARWPSAAAGTLLVPVVWALARALFADATWPLLPRSIGARPAPARGYPARAERRARTAALIAAALTALSPFQVYFAQEARNYALLALFATLATYCLWRALTAPEPGCSAARSARDSGAWWAMLAGSAPRGEPSARGQDVPGRAAGGAIWWVAYAVAAGLTLYTHYYGALVLLFHGCYVLVTTLPGLLRSREKAGDGGGSRVGDPPPERPADAAGRQLAAFALAAFGAGLLYAPWLAGLASQLYRLWRQPDFWAGSIDAWTVVGRTFSAFTLGHQDRWAELLPIVGGLALLCLVGGALVLRGAALRPGAALFLLLYPLVPAAALYAITANNPKFAERYLIALAPPVTLLLARALAEPFGWRRRLGPLLGGVLGAAALAASAWATLAVYHNPLYAKDDNRGAVAYIDAHAGPNDVALLLLDTSPTYELYSRGRVPHVGLDGAQDLDVAVADLNRIAAGHDRLWLLLWHEHWADRNGLIAGILQDQATELSVEQRFKGLGLRLFELPGRPFSVEPPHRHSAGFEGRVEFLGFGTPNPGAAAGDLLRLGLYWRSLRPVDDDLLAVLTLRDAAGRAWGTVNARPSGYYLSTTEWEPGAQYRGEFDLRVEPGAPPGVYALELGLFDAAGGVQGVGREWRILGPDGASLGTRLTLPLDFVVFRPEPLPEPEAFPSDVVPAGALPLAGGGRLEAVGAHWVDGRAVRQGDALALAVHWRRSGEAPPVEPTLSVQVEPLGVDGSQGAAPLSLLTTPPVPGYPAAVWRPGDILTGQYRLAFPPDVAPGSYRMVAREVGAEGEVALGEVRIEPLARSFTPSAGYPAPGWARPFEATFGGAASLLGFDLRAGPAARRLDPDGDGTLAASAADPLDLVLYWRVDARLTRRYKVFAHLLDREGHVAAQTDLAPMGGARPTTTWLPGEYIVDGRAIPLRDVPVGRYTLRIGLYDEETGERLPITAGSGTGRDYVDLPAVVDLSGPPR